MGKDYDVKRNYYADLELPTTASVDDVKKQYRKLALQYHPDRNAGKELEVIPKFQAIQAAHEILGDPAKKILYDADRRKQSMFGTTHTSTPNQRGHPYQATSNFPPPPRRTQPGEYKRQPSSQPRPQSNGANRFSGFAGTAPPPPPRPDPTQDRTNMFKAWQTMNNAQERQQPRNNGTASGTSTPNAQSTPRRPQPPPREDTKFPMNDAGRPAHPTHSRPSPYDQDGADTRRSAWDAVNKKAQQSSQPGVRRSNTNRTPRKHGFDPNAPGSDERPASGSYYVHRHRSEDFGQPFDTASPPRTARRPNIDPMKPNRPPPHADNTEAPFSEGNRKRTPYTSFIGEKTEFSSSDLRRSRSTRDAARMSDAAGRSRPHSTSPQSRTGAYNRAAKPATFDLPESDSDMTPGSDSSGSADGSAFSRTPNFHRPPGERPKKVPSPPSRRFGTRDKTSTSTRADGAPDTDARSRSNIFNFANGAVPFPPSPMPNGKSASEENINLKFAQSWNGTFEGTGNGATSQPLSRKPTYNRQSNSKNRSTFGQPSPLGGKHSIPEQFPPPPPGPAPNASGNNTPHEPKFTEFAFNNPTWTVPPPPSPLSRANQDTDDQTHASTKPPEDVSPSTTRQQNGNAQPATVSPADNDEMDIDDTPPSTAPAQATAEASAAIPSPTKSIRMVSVPPSQWRQQQAANSHHVRAASSSQTQPSSSTSFKTNLDDLSHVEPLARPTNAGLDLSGLSTDLPFKSQASNILPFQHDSPQVLNIPSVPIPPPVPQNLTKQTWHSYSTAFAIYLKHFHSFNAQVLRHLTAREALAERMMSQGMTWLEATGDVSGDSGANGPTGFGAYAREVKEDVRVREAWSVGCDRHVQAVSVFDQTRERVRRLASTGGLVDR